MATNSVQVWRCYYSDKRKVSYEISRKNYFIKKAERLVAGGTGYTDGCDQTVNFKVGKRSKYEYMEKEIIVIDKDLETELKEELEQFMPKFSTYIAIGVMCCIISVIPVVTFDVLENEFMVLVSVGLLLLIVACGVYMMVKAGIVKGSYNQLLQVGDFSIEHKKMVNKLEPIAPVYWITVTIIYFVVSFLTDKWNITWMIWPVVGMVFGIISIIIQNKVPKDNK